MLFNDFGRQIGGVQQREVPGFRFNHGRAALNPIPTVQVGEAIFIHVGRMMNVAAHHTIKLFFFGLSDKRVFKIRDERARFLDP